MIPIEAGDGATSAITVFDHEGLTDSAPILLVKPAMGVRASFYAPLADGLASAGLRLATADRDQEDRIQDDDVADVLHVFLLFVDL